MNKIEPSTSQSVSMNKRYILEQKSLTNPVFSNLNNVSPLHVLTDIWK